MAVIWWSFAGVAAGVLGLYGLLMLWTTRRDRWPR
jgi:hypothetical protein